MRMPKNPKPFDELVSSYEPNDLVRLLGSDIGSLPKDRYLHWDQLRYLPPPEGFTSLDWWTAVKFKRMVSRHELPFKDTRGRSFSFSDTGDLYRQLHQVDRNASGRIEVPHGDVVSSGSRERYLMNSLIEEAITSSQLEGAVTTRRVAKELLRSGRSPRDNSERMIVNNYSGMEFLRENIDEELTVPMFIDLQRTLTEGTLDPDAVGRLRRPTDVVAVVDQRDGEVMHTPPDASQLSDRVELLLDFANGRTGDDPFLHPVVKAILLHFMGRLRPSVCRWKWTDRKSPVLLVYGEIGVLADRVPFHFGGHSEGTRSVRSCVRVLRDRRQRRHVFPRLQPADDPRLDPPIARVLGAQGRRDEQIGGYAARF